MMNDNELLIALEENGFEPSSDNLEILKEEINNMTDEDVLAVLDEGLGNFLKRNFAHNPFSKLAAQEKHNARVAAKNDFKRANPGNHPFKAMSAGDKAYKEIDRKIKSEVAYDTKDFKKQVNNAGDKAYYNAKKENQKNPGLEKSDAKMEEQNKLLDKVRDIGKEREAAREKSKKTVNENFFSDSDLLEILENSGCRPTYQNLQLLKEGLENGTINFDIPEVVNEEIEAPDIPEPAAVKPVKKQPEYKKPYKSHTDEFLKKYLTEYCDFKESEVADLNESTKIESMTNIAKSIISSIVDKMEDIDTSPADRSRGEIKSLKELPELQASITQLETMVERSAGVQAEAKKYIGTVIKTILYLNQYSSVFKDAYRNKKTLLIVKYQSLILSIISAVSYLISTLVDFGMNSVELKKNIELEEIAPLKSLANFNKSVESGEFKIITNDMTLVREYYNENSVETMGSLCESTQDVINMVVGGIKNWLSGINTGELTQKVYKWTGIVVLLMSVRDALYSLARMRTKASDMLAAIKNFANINNGGSGILKALSGFTKNFVVDAETSSDMGTSDVESENRKISTQVRAIKAAPVIDAAPILAPVDTKVPDAADIMSFNF